MNSVWKKLWAHYVRSSADTIPCSEVRNRRSCWLSQSYAHRVGRLVSYDLNEQLSQLHTDVLFVDVPYEREELGLDATDSERNWT